MENSVADESIVCSDLLVVGLGNPGKEYEKTRHNAGFLVGDRLFEELGGVAASGGWKSKFQGHFSVFSVNRRKIILLKPDTYMNESGRSVQLAAKFYKIPIGHICVVHDDMDFALGAVRLKVGGGDGGHNGLRSISQALSSKNYLRIRFGIGRPNIAQNADIDSEFVHSGGSSTWVLGKFSKGELSMLDRGVASASNAVQRLMKDGFTRAQNSINEKKS